MSLRTLCKSFTRKSWRVSMPLRDDIPVENILAISVPPSHIYKASGVATSNVTINSLTLAYNPTVPGWA